MTKRITYITKDNTRFRIVFKFIGFMIIIKKKALQPKKTFKMCNINGFVEK